MFNATIRLINATAQRNRVNNYILVIVIKYIEPTKNIVTFNEYRINLNEEIKMYTDIYMCGRKL